MTTERGTRKLAAIMFTDIKSFSKKMSANEELAMEILRVHDDTLKGTIEKYEGKIIKAIGDAFMVDFSSAVNAVKCAIESQEEFYKYNKGKTELEMIEVRIGVHLGDVITDGNDIFGDGVNIASRIEAVAEPNRICISQDVYSQIKNKMQVKTFHMGSIDLKNIPEPMEIYEILMDNIPEFAVPSKTAQSMPSSRKAERTTKREAKEAEKVEAAKKKADEEKQRAERETAEKVQQLLAKAEKLTGEGKLDAAERELNEIFKHVAFHAGAQMLQARIDEKKQAKAEEERKEAAAQRKIKQQVGELMEEALRMVDEFEFEDAKEKLNEIFEIDPANEDARELELRVKEEEQKPRHAEPKHEPEAATSLVDALEERAELPPEPAAQPRAPQPLRRHAGLKEKPKAMSPIVRNLIIGGVILIVGFFLYPTIQNVFFPKDYSVLVAPFIVPGGENDSTGLQTTLAGLLEDDLSAYPELTVVRTGNLQGRRSSPAQLASSLQARYVLSGQVLTVAPRFSAVLRLSTAAGTGTAAEWTVNDESFQFNALRSGVVSKVLEMMHVETSPRAIQPLTQDSDLNAMYSVAAWYASQFNRDDVLRGTMQFREILLIDSTFLAAQVGLGRALLKQFEIEGERDKSLLRDAVDAAIRARNLNPASAEAFEILGSAYMAAGRLNLAPQTLRQVLDLAPGNPAAHRELALLSLTRGEYDRAFELASKALMLDPNHPESHEVMGHSMYFKQQYASAEREYDKAIALGGASYFITTRYKMAVWGAGLSPEPVAQYCNRLLRQDSTNYVVRYWAGRAYMLSGIWSEARKYLEPGAESLRELLERDPGDANARAYLALYYARLGESVKGQAEIDKAMQLTGGAVLTMYRKAQFYAIQTEKKSEALQWLQKAVRQEFILAEVMNPDFAFLIKDPEFPQAIAVPETGSGG